MLILCHHCEAPFVDNTDRRGRPRKYCGKRCRLRARHQNPRQRKRTPRRCYIEQRRNARERNIPFHLTFEEWLAVWQRSGMWNLRGRGQEAACMSRVGDSGAYEIGNVYINTVRNNSSEAGTRARRSQKPKTALSLAVSAAGGPAVVAKMAGIKRPYLAHLMASGHVPSSWITDGRIQKIAELTAGAYSAEQIIRLAVAA